MPTAEQLQEWKKKYGRIRKVKLDDTDYYYRGITLDEYHNIQKLSEVDEKTVGDLEVVKCGLLTPELPEKPGAGIVLKLSDEILILSGFTQNSVPEEL